MSQRDFRNGIVDGDDVWPADLTTDDLEVIARIDRATAEEERGRFPSATAEAGGVVFSIAERVRHWRALVDDLENGADIHPGEYATEVGCRELIARQINVMPDGLRIKLATQLLDPLDQRFEANTIDDGGIALAREVKLANQPVQNSRLARRPTRLPELWNRQG